MKLELDLKWNYGIKIGKCPFHRAGFSPFINIWFLKFKTLPEDGEMFSKEHYKGLYWYFEPLSYFYIIMRTFKNPFKIGRYYYSIPIKIRLIRK